MNGVRLLHSGGEHYSSNHDHSSGVKECNPDEAWCEHTPLTRKLQIASISFGIFALALVVGIVIYCYASRRQVRDRRDL